MDGLETARRLIAEERKRKTGFLDLGRLGLTDLPDSLFELAHLLSLNLGNHYRDAGDQYQESANAGASNSIRSLPQAIEKLNALRHLSLSFNPISTLAPIRSLVSLQSLVCSGTQVSDLSPVSDVSTLSELTANSCKLRVFLPCCCSTPLSRSCASTKQGSLASRRKSSRTTITTTALNG